MAEEEDEASNEDVAKCHDESRRVLQVERLRLQFRWETRAAEVVCEKRRRRDNGEEL